MVGEAADVLNIFLNIRLFESCDVAIVLTFAHSAVFLSSFDSFCTFVAFDSLSMAATVKQHARHSSNSSFGHYVALDLYSTVVYLSFRFCLLLLNC